MLFQCGRWARHCYITSLLTLHWSINNRPIQIANNRPIYVVGCTWSSNTCKVLYFWFGGQNDLLRTMWYFIIQLILHLCNILGLVSGKFEISRLYKLFIEQSRVEVQQVCLLRGALIMSIMAVVLATFTSTWTCLDSQSFDPLTRKCICPERRIFSLSACSFKWRIGFDLEWCQGTS